MTKNKCLSKATSLDLIIYYKVCVCLCQIFPPDSTIKSLQIFSGAQIAFLSSSFGRDCQHFSPGTDRSPSKHHLAEVYFNQVRLDSGVKVI